MFLQIHPAKKTKVKASAWDVFPVQWLTPSEEQLRGLKNQNKFCPARKTLNPRDTSQGPNLDRDGETPLGGQRETIATPAMLVNPPC